MIAQETAALPQPESRVNFNSPKKLFLKARDAFIGLREKALGAKEKIASSRLSARLNKRFPSLLKSKQDIAVRTLTGQVELSPIETVLQKTEAVADHGNDQYPFEVIEKTILNSEFVDVKHHVEVTRAILVIYQAINNSFPEQVLNKDSGFAILHDGKVPTSLPDGAVAFFFDKEPLEIMAGFIDGVINKQELSVALTTFEQEVLKLTDGKLLLEELISKKISVVNNLLKISNSEKIDI